jgi:hypothetical protein
MIVELRERDSQYPDLTPGQPYLVLGIEADDFRILNDQGRPYLYPREIFTVVDPREPDDWVKELGEDNEPSATPIRLPSTASDSLRTTSTASSKRRHVLAGDEPAAVECGLKARSVTSGADFEAPSEEAPLLQTGAERRLTEFTVELFGKGGYLLRSP